MSGICGIFSPRDPLRVSREALDPMIAAIAHRGRAARRWFVDPRHGIAIGHVFDPLAPSAASAARPHWRETSEWILALDGAVFGADGHHGDPGADRAEESSPASADVTIAARALERDPAAFPVGLDGAFALVAWNRARGELMLARDGLGVRPLHYAWLPARGLLLFASELKGLLAHPAMERDVDREALHAYLTFGYVPAPLTLFKDARKVFPGESLRIGRDGAPVSRSHWTPPPFEPRPRGLEECAAEVRERMIESVRKHAAGAERAGVFLSGGIDSTIVLGVLERLGAECETFTLGFRNEQHPRMMEDARWAERVADRFGTRHHALILDECHDPMPLLPRILRHCDEPMLAVNLYTKSLLAGSARAAGVSCCMSGTSAGLLFERFPAAKVGKLAARAGDDADVEAMVLASRNRFVPCEEQGEFLVDPHPDPRAVALAVVERYRRGLEGAEASDLISGTVLRMQVAEKNIGAQERVSALSGLELRHPFYDPAIVGVASAIPARFLGSETPEMRKAVLRRAFADLLPEEVANREVIGFASYYWTRGEIDALKRSLLSPAAIEEAGLFRPAAVAKVLEEDAASPKRSAGKRTWGLLMAQVWFRLFIQKRDDLVLGLILTLGSSWSLTVLDVLAPTPEFL